MGIGKKEQQRKNKRFFQKNIGNVTKFRYTILDNEGNPATMTVSFEDGKHLEIKDLKFHDINTRIEVL